MIELKQLADKLSRVTSSRNFIPEVDGLRFIAIATVVLFHFRTHILRTYGFDAGDLSGDPFFAFLTRGGLGVNIFFTISGFILAVPFARQHLYGGKPVELGKYYLRRVARIEPPYVIIMSFFFVAMIMLYSDSFASLGPHYVASLLYLHFFIYGTWSVINPVAWSLETEVQFYLFAPFMSFLFRVKGAGRRMLLCVGIILFHFLMLHLFFDAIVEYHLGKSVVIYFSDFFLGFLLVDLYLHFKDRVAKSVVFDVAGLTGLIFIYGFYRSDHLYQHFLFLVATSLVFAGAFKGTILNWFITRKFVTVVGGMCYTIYLVHYVFIFFVVEIAKSVISRLGNWGNLPQLEIGFYTAFWLNAVFLLPLLLFVSSIIFYFIEKPFMRPEWQKNIKFKIR